MNVNIALSLPVTEQMCKDVLTTAVEGGSHYWLACEKIVRDQKDHNVVQIIGCYDVEDEDTKFGDVDFNTIIQGFERILTGAVVVNANLKQQALMMLVDDDYTGWDADTADAILQVGLLNEITYG